MIHALANRLLQETTTAVVCSHQSKAASRRAVGTVEEALPQCHRGVC